MSDALTAALASAITRMENINPAYNNPGAITSHGALVQYPTLEQGQQALYNQIDLNRSRGLTLYEFFAGKPDVYPGYSPAGAGNNPANYAQFVSGQTGVGVDTILPPPGTVNVNDTTAMAQAATSAATSNPLLLHPIDTSAAPDISTAPSTYDPYAASSNLGGNILIVAAVTLAAYLFYRLL